MMDFLEGLNPEEVRLELEAYDNFSDYYNQTHFLDGLSKGVVRFNFDKNAWDWFVVDKNKVILDSGYDDPLVVKDTVNHCSSKAVQSMRISYKKFLLMQALSRLEFAQAVGMDVPDAYVEEIFDLLGEE